MPDGFKTDSEAQLPTEPALTVAVVTRNRARSLDGVLRSLEVAFRHRTIDVEILIVLNACRDTSRAVCAAHAERLPIRVIEEERVGISHARNAAICAAKGRYVAWLDDDVILDQSWLAAYDQAIRVHPDAVLFGGPIIPMIVGQPPEWFRRTWPMFANVYGERRPRSDGPIDPSYVPFGGNYMVRTDVQRQFRFDPALGRQRGHLLLGGEETSAIRKMLSAGVVGRWVAAAVVLHVVPTSRQTVRHLVRYFAGQGYVDVLGRKQVGGFDQDGIAPHVGAMVKSAGQAMRALMRDGPEIWVPEVIDASRAYGRIVGQLAERARRRKSS